MFSIILLSKTIISCNWSDSDEEAVTEKLSGKTNGHAVRTEQQVAVSVLCDERDKRAAEGYGRVVSHAVRQR